MAPWNAMPRPCCAAERYGKDARPIALIVAVTAIVGATSATLVFGLIFVRDGSALALLAAIATPWLFRLAQPGKVL